MSPQDQSYSSDRTAPPALPFYLCLWPPRRLVVCIDDDVQGLALRKALLQTQGYDVLTATSGPAGLRLLQQFAVHAVILDYTMPGMDGAAVAAEIRKHWPRIPIIVLSGHDITELPRGFLSLVDRFVQKPSCPGELSSLLKQLTDWPADMALQVHEAPESSAGTTYY